MRKLMTHVEEKEEEEEDEECRWMVHMLTQVD